VIPNQCCQSTDSKNFKKFAEVEKIFWKVFGLLCCFRICCKLHVGVHLELARGNNWQMVVQFSSVVCGLLNT